MLVVQTVISGFCVGQGRQRELILKSSQKPNIILQKTTGVRVTSKNELENVNKKFEPGIGV